MGRMELILFLWGTVLLAQCEASPRGDGVDERYFCNGICGVFRERCSCMSVCKISKNCCTDYVESCEGGESWTNTDCTPVGDMTCPHGYTHPIPLLILSIDGFRDTYLERNMTPTISKLANCGSKAPYTLGVYPTKTFPNHYTLATGLYPESHGIIANKMYNHDTEEEFRVGQESSFNPEWWKGEPIWVSASNQGLKSAAYFWPGSDVKIKQYPDYWYKYDPDKKHEERVYQMLDWMVLPRVERPSLTVMYTRIVDQNGHESGPFSKEVDDSLVKADQFVEMIMNGLRDRGLDSCVNLLIVSDHGMANIDCDSHVTYLDKYGVNTSEVYIDNGTYARIGKSPNKSLWGKFDAEKIKKQLECKSDETHWEAFLKDEYLPKRYHYANNPLIEDVHLVMEQEWWVAGSSTGDSGCILGDHGYDSLYDDMRSVFVCHGYSLMRGYTRSEPFEIVELYNMYADLLNINPAPNNGTRGSLFDFFAHSLSVEKESPGKRALSCIYDPKLNSGNLGCSDCSTHNSTETNENLHMSYSEVENSHALHFLYGPPRILDPYVDYCVLTQRNYVTTYDMDIRMPRLISFVLQKGNTWNGGERCTTRDVRLLDDFVTCCDMLYSPNLANDSTKSEATISSNMVPVYPAFMEIWNYMQMTLNTWANRYNGISVDVGPIFDYDYNGIADSEAVRNSKGKFLSASQETPIPTHFFMVITRCKDRSAGNSVIQCSNNIHNIEVLSFIIPNYKEAPCHKVNEPLSTWVPRSLSRHTARIKDVELITKISFFSKWVTGEATAWDQHYAIRHKLFQPQRSYDWIQDFSASTAIKASWICLTLAILLTTAADYHVAV